MPRLLLLEDRAPLVDFYRSLAVAPDWIVDVARDTASAVVHIAYHRPDAVLVDADLGGWASGPSSMVVGLIQNLAERLTGVPIVVLSPLGHQGPCVFEAAGATVVLPAMASPRQVRVALENTIAGSRAARKEVSC